MDADKTSGGVRLPVLISLVDVLLGRNIRGGTIIVGPSTLAAPSTSSRTRWPSPNWPATSNLRPSSFLSPPAGL